ncbi:MAG: FGGY family carbohydrate kinase [Anaerolineae bacterium]|nr:FGGY family carbohydrate kinase [Anaerolineae bacterium]
MSLLGIDVGTSGCKATALSAEGATLATAYREYDVVRPQPGWAELDSRAVWGKIQDVIAEVAAQTRHDPIVSLCVSSMGEAMTPVSAAREILGNCIMGFDARGAETVARLEQMDPIELYEITGNVPAGLFAGPKLVWQRDNRPDLFARTDKFLGWAGLVIYMLGCDPVIDYSLANRTLLFDLRAATWSQTLLDWVGLPAEKLPTPVPSGSVVGEVSDAVAARLGLPRGVKVVAGAHDQCASAVGAGVTRAGDGGLRPGDVHPHHANLRPHPARRKDGVDQAEHRAPRAAGAVRELLLQPDRRRAAQVVPRHLRAAGEGGGAGARRGRVRPAARRDAPGAD